jgi:hypothetical protein
MLFSEGFEDSKVLSRKMVQLYKLANEQLSQQVGTCLAMQHSSTVARSCQEYTCAPFSPCF